MNDQEVYVYLRRIASKFVKNGFDLEDLISVAYLGYADALEKFDESKGIQFKSYAERRISGTIMDYIRSNIPGKRSMRGDDRPVIESFDEIMSSTPENPHRLYLSLVHKTSDAGEPVDFLLMKQVKDAVEALPERERDIVTRYFWGDQRMDEIGLEIGITESRVSQIIKRAGIRIRKTLTNGGEMKRLSEEEIQRTIQMINVSGTYSEAARKLGIPVGTLCNRISRNPAIKAAVSIGSKAGDPLVSVKSELLEVKQDENGFSATATERVLLDVIVRQQEMIEKLFDRLLAKAA